jgi:preprotein translocase subunit SecA
VSIFEKILRAGEGRILRRLSAISAAVNSIEDNYTELTDAELRELTDQYKQRYQDGE